MTNMRRVTIAIPENIDKEVLELRKDNRFVRCSYSEIVRQALEHGIEMVKREATSRDSA